MDENELERALRAGLEVRSTEVDVTAPVVDRAQAQVSRRRRTRWSAVGAAAAVVLVVGGVAVATRGGDDGVEPPVSNPSATEGQPPRTGEWRTEYWGSVAVDVPADWAYGGAPVESGGDVVACYPEAMIGADGSRLRQSGDRGWVGRPIGVTDVCALYPWLENSPQEEPSAPYVWLGAAVEPGIVEYGNGVVQETVEVAGTTVTVASDDSALRRAVLDSVRPGELCEPSLSRVPDAQDPMTREGIGGLLSAEVCAYRREGDAGDYLLSYAEAVDLADAIQSFARAGDGQVVDCDATDSFEFVVLRGTYDDPMGGRIGGSAVFEMGCGGQVTVESGPTREMTPAAVEPWAHNGIPAVVYGPTGGKGAMIDSFIGPQD